MQPSVFTVKRGSYFSTEIIKRNWKSYSAPRAFFIILWLSRNSIICGVTTTIWNNCWIELHLLGLRTGREQCWSNQAIAVWFRSLKLDVETIPLNDSNNGLIIMLNCKSSNVKGDNKGGVKTSCRKGYYSSVCREINWLLNGLQVQKGLQHFKKYFFKSVTLRQRKNLNLTS